MLSLIQLPSVFGTVLGTVFRYFAYRFWVFREELDTEPGYERDIAVITGQMPYVTQQPEDVPAATAENPHAVERDPSRATANRPQRPAA